MDAIGDSYLKEQLQHRRERLLVSTTQSKENSSVPRLLKEVDDALRRMEEGTYGLCETCHDCVEKDRLLAALRRTGGNRTLAARMLGIGRATLYRRMSSLNLPVE